MSPFPPKYAALHGGRGEEGKKKGCTVNKEVTAGRKEYYTIVISPRVEVICDSFNFS